MYRFFHFSLLSSASLLPLLSRGSGFWCFSLVLLLSLLLLPYCSSDSIPTTNSNSCSVKITGAPTGCGTDCFRVNLVADPCSDTSSATRNLRVYSGSLNLANVAASSFENTDIKNLIIVVHSLSYNPVSEMSHMVSAVAGISKATSTAVIAPLFTNVSANVLYWSGASWRYGGNAVNSNNNAFAITDAIIETFFSAAKFPNLQTVTIAGHSAGAQFSQRYAAIHRGLNGLASGRQFYYIVSNPSSYVYLDNARVRCDGTSFAVPDTTTATINCGDRTQTCISNGDYNQYQYGLADATDSQSRLHYSNTLTSSQIAMQYRGRNVVYLLGARDTTRATSDCPSQLQGEQSQSRFNRGLTYLEYMNARFRPHSHRQITVPNVGHDAAIFNQATTRTYLNSILAD